MYFNFIDTAYSVIIILFLIASFITKGEWKKWCSNLIAVSNTLLIFYSIYLINSLVSLIRLALSLNIQPPKDAPVPSIGWFEIRYLLLMVLPFLFISKTLAKNKIAVLIMLVLLQWDIVHTLYKMVFTKETSSGFLFYLPYNIEFRILHFISLFIGTYALLWLLKRLPSQQAK